MKFKVDAIERFVATTLEVGLPYATVEMFNLPIAWVPLGTIMLTAIKIAIARNIGKPNSASLAKEV